MKKRLLILVLIQGMALLGSTVSEEADAIGDRLKILLQLQMDPLSKVGGEELVAEPPQDLSTPIYDVLRPLATVQRLRVLKVLLKGLMAISTPSLQPQFKMILEGHY